MDETINTIDGKTMCDHCFNEHTTICDHCGKRILREDAMGDSHYTLLYTYYKGQQITFPIKLFKSECLSEMIKKQYDGTNAKKLARTYGYSERWIKELLRNK